MRYRTLGRTGFEISEIGFGAWGIGGDWGSVDDAEALRALKTAIDLGITFIDTALGYGNGHSEHLVGQAIEHIHDDVVIATKIPPKTYRWPVYPQEPVTETFPADWIVECTEQSLRNLGVDHIDVQQLHAWTPTYIEQTEWYDALTKLKEQGKIRAFGVSVNDWDAHGGVDLVKSGMIDTVQVIYNIFEQRPAEALLPAALSANVGVIVRVPFEEGLLTGRIRPGRKFAKGDWRAQFLTPDRIAEAARRLDAFDHVRERLHLTPADLALKFCLSHPAVSTVIPGMRKATHVKDNASAADGELLSVEDRAELMRHAFAHGWTYPWAAASPPEEMTEEEADGE